LEREAPVFELLEREELFELDLRDLLRDVPDPEFARAIASLLVGNGRGRCSSPDTQ